MTLRPRDAQGELEGQICVVTETTLNWSDRRGGRTPFPDALTQVLNKLDDEAAGYNVTLAGKPEVVIKRTHDNRVVLRATCEAKRTDQ